MNVQKTLRSGKTFVRQKSSENGNSPSNKSVSRVLGLLMVRYRPSINWVCKCQSLLRKTHAYLSVDILLSEFLADSTKRDLYIYIPSRRASSQSNTSSIKKIDGSHQSWVLKSRSTRWKNSIINFSKSEFPADFSTKETYEKRSTSKIRAAAN